MIARFTHRPAHPLGRRLLDAFRSRFVGGLGKSQRVYFVNINGQRYKRVVFGDSAQAAAVVESLEACGEAVALPRLFHQHESELWFEFVEGQALSGAEPDHREALASLFAGLYARNPTLMLLDDSPLHERLLSDLLFLRQVGVIGQDMHRKLERRAEAIRPQQAWFGLDYLDPVLKNFLIKDQRAVIIDVESIGPSGLLGIGIAKSELHWLEHKRAAFADRVIELGAPDFRPQLDYARLALIAGWTKRKLLAGKRQRIKLAYFDQCLK